MVSVYNVHIPIQLGDPTLRFFEQVHQQAERRDAARHALAADLSTNHGARLVAGDLNTTPAMGELFTLDRLLRAARPTDGEIYPASWNARNLGLWQLDFVHQDAAIDIDRYSFRGSSGLSDHDAQDLWVTTA